MREKKILLGILLLFLPMGLVWFGYGEKGYYGYAMLTNVFFTGGLLWLIASVRFRWIGTFCGIVGSLMLLGSYALGAVDFCGHLPEGVSPLAVCRVPMLVSLVGAVLVIWGLFDFHKKKIEMEGEEQCNPF